MSSNSSFFGITRRLLVSTLAALPVLPELFLLTTARAQVPARPLAS